MRNESLLGARPTHKKAPVRARGRSVAVIAIALFVGAISSLPAAHASAPEARPSVQAPINPNSEVPPASAFDLHREGSAVALNPETRGLLWQMVRTCIALAAVLALIFTLAKVLLPRFAMRAKGGETDALRVSSRLMLDSQHQVLLLKVKQDRELLLGLGPQGVQLICEISPAEGKALRTFQADAQASTGSL